MEMRFLATALITTLGFLGRAESNCGGSKDPPKDSGSGTTSSTAAAKEVNLPGVDTGALTGTEKAAYSTYVSEFLAPCADTPVPVAQCVEEKRACKKCLPAAKFIALGIRRGFPKSKLEDAYKARFDAEKVKNVPLDGSPVTGPASAPITIVEFADFECPHCGAMAPVLDKVVEKNKATVRFSYKFLPLPMHQHADPAALAAFAAWKQNKFWEMHHKIYQNQLKLDMSDLETYATELGCELGRFRIDIRSADARAKVDADKKLADDLKVESTPAIYINGRTFGGPEDLDEFIGSELEMMGIDPKTLPAPTATAAPSASGAGKDGGPATKPAGTPTLPTLKK